MKRFALAFATLLILVAVAPAQSGSFIVADVPFTFHVQDTHASAGTHRISYHGSSNDYLVLKNNNGINVVAGLTFHGGKSVSSAIPKLVFHKYGEEYFLVGIQMPNYTLQDVPLGDRSKVTHRLVTHGQPEEVTVIAQLKK